MSHFESRKVPKPFHRPYPKPERLPERKAVTIIAGFKCNDGIVLCADTQETIGDSKRNVPKLRFEPLDPPFGSDVSSLATAFCGAGNGPFIDKLVDVAWKSAQVASSLDDACDRIEQAIKGFYEEFGRIYQPGYCPTVELIYGVKMKDEDPIYGGFSRMFHASGPIINEKFGYSAAGIGDYMAAFLASRMYDKHLNIRQCIILAAYVLFQAKEHVDGCGGESHIAVLRNDGTSGLVDASNVKTITELLETADKRIGSVIMQYADIGLSDTQFDKQSREELEILLSLRQHRLAELINHVNALEATFGMKFSDDLGLPIDTSSPWTQDDSEDEK
jgi:hypothetical protein